MPFSFYYEQSINQHEYASICMVGYGGVVQLARLYGNSIFSLLKYLHTDFHHGYSSLHAHQQWITAPLPHTLTSICCHLQKLYFLYLVSGC